MIIFNVNNKQVLVRKEVKYINNIPHIECSYLKAFISIYEFRIRASSNKKTFIFDQPSRPGQKQWKRDKLGSKPKFPENKIINGVEQRFCSEMKIYLPLPEFRFYINRKGKIIYQSVSRQGKKIENIRNKESTRKAIKRWKIKNKHKVNANTSLRRSMRINATPPWLTDHHIKLIENIYNQREIISKATGIEYQVHHIFPLKGSLTKKGEQISSGLHVPWNMIIIPADINNSINSLNPGCHNYDLKEYKNIQTEYTIQSLNFLFNWI